MIPVTRLDHLVYATNDVARTSARLGELLGVNPGIGGKHVGRGTHNTLLSFGNGVYLEVIGPDPDQPNPVGARPFGVDDIHGERLVAWSISTSSMSATLAAARALGCDPGEAMPMQRQTPSGDLLSWQLTAPHLENGLGLVPFVIDWGSGADVSNLHPSVTAPTGVRLESFTGTHPSPELINEQLRALTNVLTIGTGPKSTLCAVLAGPTGSVTLGS